MYRFFILTLVTLKTLTAQAYDLKVGDLLLQPMSCSLCTLITEEESTRFAHVGLVLSTSPQVLIAEALGNVHTISLPDFVARTTQGETILALRYRNSAITRDLESRQPQLEKLFQSEYGGLSYDSEFRWNNFDSAGNEKMYCSEMITKLMQQFNGLELPVKRMHFLKNREKWSAYFHGNIPDGQWGNGPADFERSDLFYVVDEI